MKNIFLITLVISLLSCSQNIDELNTNVKNPETVPGEALFTSAQKELMDQITSTSVNRNVFRLFTQYWTETVYTDETNYEIVNRNIPQTTWRILYRDVLKNLDQATIELNKIPTATPTELAVKNNKIQITEIVKIFAFSVLVETFGDIPYSEALNTQIKLPKYDDGLMIYKDLIARLNTAIENLDTTNASFGNGDNIYQGDTSKWLMLANSLKLRMGITLSDIPSESTLAKTTIEAAALNVFKSPEDSALFTYLGAPPNTNPLFTDLVASERTDFVPANTFVDVVNELEDPRRAFFFDDNIKDPDTDAVIYKGGTYGSSNSFPNFTHFNSIILNPEYKGILMNYTEVQFLLAEAAAKGMLGSTSDAEGYYNEAITASILDWGGTQDDASAYLSKPEVSYATAGTTWQEKIGTQAWIGLYNRGYEAWSTWRRLDYPILIAPETAISVIPVRLTYPVNEQTLNTNSYKAGASAIGGDMVGTKLFWDQN